MDFHHKYMRYHDLYLPKATFSPEWLKFWEEFTFSPDDVIVSTYPKSGTNWALDLASLVLSGGDLTVVDSVATWDRCALIGENSTHIKAFPSPGVYATHFHYNMMPKSFHQVKPKVINVVRNPKDVLISAYFFFNKSDYHFTWSSPKEFLDKFLVGEVPEGSWFDNVKSWLSFEDKSRILYLTYEEMLQDLRQVVVKISQFLEKPLDDDAIDRITERCLFKNMKKKNTSKDVVDHTVFYRKGAAGDWKNYLSEEDAQLFDSVLQEKMKDVDFPFKWD